MAGDWIKFEHATPDKPEVHQMADMLGISPEQVVGHLVRFWIWVDQQSVDCANALSVTKVTLDRLTHCENLASAMQKVGWLAGENWQLQVPNLERHNGETAKKRALTAKRVARHKANSALTLSALPKEEKSIDIANAISNRAKQKNGQKRFKPPTVEQVAEHCQNKQITNVDPEAFVNFYESKGWMVGKNKMKSWPHAIANWSKTNAQQTAARQRTNHAENMYNACKEFAESDTGDLDSEPVRETGGTVRPQVVEFIPRRHGESGDG